MVAATEVRTWKLAAPHRASHGSMSERTTILLRLELDGLVGWGEAAPLASYDGGDIGTCRAALDRACNSLTDADIDRPGDACDALAGELPSQARAALTTALLDLAARRAGVPLWRHLNAAGGSRVQLSRLIERGDREALKREVADARRSGFGAMKVKLGLEGDADAVVALRDAAGPRTLLIGDANGAWSAEEAKRALTDLQTASLDLVEQPVRGVDAMRSLAAGGAVPIALDEDATADGAFGSPPCADSVCIKLQAWGGADRMLAAAGSARSTGMRVYVGSTFEGPVGIAAGLHCAAAIGPDLPCGLATLDSFEGVFPGVPVADGSWLASDRPGLGVDPDGAAA